jgi:hypothetical protein
MLKMCSIPAVACLLGLIVSTKLQSAEGDSVFFNEKVWPLIMNKCVPCHREGKSKGGLFLNSRNGWIEGSKTSRSNFGHSTVVSGDPANSIIIKLIDRTYFEDGLHMPPEKDEALTPEQVKIIADWIAQGLPWPE